MIDQAGQIQLAIIIDKTKFRLYAPVMEWTAGFRQDLGQVGFTQKRKLSLPGREFPVGRILGVRLSIPQLSGWGEVGVKYTYYKDKDMEFNPTTRTSDFCSSREESDS